MEKSRLSLDGSFAGLSPGPMIRGRRMPICMMAMAAPAWSMLKRRTKTRIGGSQTIPIAGPMNAKITGCPLKLVYW